MKTEISILTILERRDPQLLREVTLRNEVEIEAGKTLSLAELKLKLRSLEASGDVISVSNADAGMKWGVTDAGRARVARALL